MKCSRCDALAVISSMWDCHFKSAVSVTPSSHVDFTCSMGLALMVSGGMCVGVLLKTFFPYDAVVNIFHKSAGCL